MSFLSPKLETQLSGFLHFLLGKLSFMLQNFSFNAPLLLEFPHVPSSGPGFTYVAVGCPCLALSSPDIEVCNRSLSFLPSSYLYNVAQGVTHHSSPKKVWEIYSDTWFPERLVSDRCVNSRFSIRLNCRER